MMERILNILKDHEKVVLFLSIVLIFSLVYAEFVLSVSILAFFLYGFFQLYRQKRSNFKVKEIWHSCFSGQNLPIITLTALFFFTFTSFFYSANTTEFWTSIRIRLPFFMFPIPFLFIPAIGKKTYRNIHYALFWIMTLSALHILVNYFVNFQEITLSMQKGKSIPTPIHHIRYSIILALATLSGILLIVDRFKNQFRKIDRLLVACTLILVLTLHVLSVRSGLIAFYIGLAFIVFYKILRQKEYFKGVLVLTAICLLPLIAYWTIPSFKSKVAYVAWDFKMQDSDEAGKYSDSQRLQSLKLGLRIGIEHPLLGVGTGDIKNKMAEAFLYYYETADKKLKPHNQFITVFASTGIIGLLVFLFVFFFPFFYSNNYQQSLFMVLGLITLFSMLVENTLDNAVGTAFFLFFLLINLNYQKGLKSE